MTKRRVLLIHHSGLLGGAGLSLLDLWRNLEREHEVRALVPESPPDLRDFLIEQGYRPKTFRGRLGKIPYYSGGESLFLPRFWYYCLLTLVQRRKWRRLVVEEKPDVVVVNSGVLCWMIGVLNGVVSICYVRETIIGKASNPVNRYMRRLRDRFDAVCYLSEYDRARDLLGSADQLLVRDAADPEYFSVAINRAQACARLGSTSRTFNVLYMGGTSLLKGYDQVLKSVSFLGGLSLQVIVAGYSGPSKRRWRLLQGPHQRRSDRELALLSRELESKGLICSTGIVADPRVAYAACDVVVFPMREPHQARPAFEAGFQGRAIIIADFPNVRECVTNGLNGLVFRPGDPKDLARAIRELLGDPARRQRMANENLDHALQFHSYAVAFKELDAFIRAIEWETRSDRVTGATPARANLNAGGDK